MDRIKASSAHAIEPECAMVVRADNLLRDLLRTVAALSENSPDKLSLIVPDVLVDEEAALLGPEAWLAQWADQSKSLAITTLAQARDDGAARATLAAIDASGGFASWDVVLSRMSGSDAMLSVARDVSERMSQEVQLRRVAYQDGLTGLLNRAALRERLDEQICVATGNGGSVSVLMLDLDNFKLINDTLGHDAGDAVLIETAARLRATVPSGNVMGRLGGDEFAVLVSSKKPGARATFLAEDLLEALRRPVTYNGRVLDTRASIGIATFPDHGSDAPELLKNADIALYAAKSFGRGGLARQIGDAMFERVAVDVRHWKNAGVPVGRIALNASAAEFRAGDFAPRLLEKLRRAELAPELFEIEVAETVLAGRGTDYVATALADLADAGVRVALDQFGTGASSLSQLKRLPFHSIKIDQTFVGTLENDIDDQAIVRAIVGLADGLGLEMTAVGVETLGQVAALRQLGCEVGQGSLLGEPASGRAVGAATRSVAA